MNLEQLWNTVLEKMHDSLNSIHYDTWFKETKINSIENGIIKIIVPFPLHKKYLKENYNGKLEEIIYEITGTNFELAYFLEDEIKTKSSDCEITEVAEEKFVSNLNPNYTFDNFIVGVSNKFAHVSALAIADSPGMMYNPLFIYGRSGVGKTHLMHAIGNYIVNTYHKNVLYVTCEQFINDFVEMSKSANNYDRVSEFKKKYRKIDALLIDDIQFL